MHGILYSLTLFELNLFLSLLWSLFFDLFFRLLDGSRSYRLEIVRLHLTSLRDRKIGDIVTELAPRLPSLLLLKLDANEIDKELHFRVGNIYRLSESFAEAAN